MIRDGTNLFERLQMNSRFQCAAATAARRNVTTRPGDSVTARFTQKRPPTTRRRTLCLRDGWGRGSARFAKRRDRHSEYIALKVQRGQLTRSSWTCHPWGKSRSKAGRGARTGANRSKNRAEDSSSVVRALIDTHRVHWDDAIFRQSYGANAAAASLRNSKDVNFTRIPACRRGKRARVCLEQRRLRASSR